MTHKDEALKLAKSWLEANTYGDEAVEVYEAIEQALAAQSAPVAWAEYNFKKGKFTGLTTDDINSVDSVGDGCQWIPQLQARAAPVQLTDEQKRELIKESELWDMHIHMGWYSAPSKSFVEKTIQLITTIEAKLKEKNTAAAVPDAITDDSESPEYRTGWNDCRQAMMEMMK